MLRLGVKVKYIKKKQQPYFITLKDLQNIHQKAKEKKTEEKTEELLIDELHQFCKQITRFTDHDQVELGLDTIKNEMIR